MWELYSVYLAPWSGRWNERTQRFASLRELMDKVGHMGHTVSPLPVPCRLPLPRAEKICLSIAEDGTRQWTRFTYVVRYVPEGD